MQCHNDGLLFVFSFFLIVPNISFFFFFLIACKFCTVDFQYLPVVPQGSFVSDNNTWCWVHHLFALCFKLDCHVICNFITPFFTHSLDLPLIMVKKQRGGCRECCHSCQYVAFSTFEQVFCTRADLSPIPHWFNSFSTCWWRTLSKALQKTAI